MIIVRPFQQDDVRDLTELMSDLGYPTAVDKMLNRMKTINEIQLYATFVAVMDGTVAGMIGARDVYYYEEDGFATQISLLVTKSEYQGRGIATKLIQYVEERAIKNGANCLQLTSGIKPERERAHQFYKARGFKVTGYRFVKKLKT
ncbi:GNAT family N-acetyltransferase [Paenibacillus nasutitermitis]|uniref:N-acetyltransferase n=1 Tax=Paenibacillus nasutitermitis TaxID=1652958 RepID=A0A916Z8G4_9BACL|nr:GNAT family N-acetyltransferase [Paenibacillus nasutitermitis]GGD81122.1 N-acetyltransferase [Paenibacillus nasutitermitis]